MPVSFVGCSLSSYKGTQDSSQHHSQAIYSISLIFKSRNSPCLTVKELVRFFQEASELEAQVCCMAAQLRENASLFDETVTDWICCLRNMSCVEIDQCPSDCLVGRRPRTSVSKLASAGYIKNLKVRAEIAVDSLGSADAEKKRLAEQLTEIDKNTEGGLQEYLRRAKKLLDESKKGPLPSSRHPETRI